jgi:hypothetical protein
VGAQLLDATTPANDLKSKYNKPFSVAELLILLKK